MNSEHDKLNSTITIIDTDKETNMDLDEEMTNLERKDTLNQEQSQAGYSPGYALQVYGTEIPPKETRTKEHREGSSQPSTSFFKKPGPRSYKGRMDRMSVDSSAIDTETYEISSSDSEVSDYVRTRGRRVTIEEDSDASPPEKINISSKGPQRTIGNRKRERIASDAESDGKRSYRTTGDYVGRKEAILRYNKAKDEALQLDREKIIREYSEAELFKKAKVNMVKVKEQLGENSIEELISKASENCTEVLRIARTSSNLKGTFQKSLKIAAATSLGIAEILKDKATLSKEEAKAQEIKSLNREISRMKARMDEEIEKERRKAMQAVGEAEAYRSELQTLKKERQEKRRDMTPSLKDKEKEKEYNKGKSTSRSPSENAKKSSSRRTPSGNIKARENLITSESDRMEVDEKSPKTKKVTLEDPKMWPEVKRPTLCGKRKIIEEDPTSQRAIYEAHKKYISESHKGNEEKRQSHKEGKEEGYKNRKNIASMDSTELAIMIRDIVAKELDRYNSKKPRITGIQTFKEPLITVNEAGKVVSINKQEREEHKSSKSTPRETPRKNAEKDRKKTITTEEETDRESKAHGVK
ncbi:PREDICTED: glutamic acid-rich protein-like [Trachymyrmex cornetzi]|uniref:glutamic acid-rich protein-like n=1 Tax=Trachymyrmex cornetzi TaxID=471704 RepID=UPI00084F5ADA|nr:PREDICTED: glutamic acid-rich protein-like [Trachymyrmex cornetzi]